MLENQTKPNLAYILEMQQSLHDSVAFQGNYFKGKKLH